jgi:diguanylate cyclase (GGDEF)-like protein/PAS domain S-box-containing protein
VATVGAGHGTARLSQKAFTAPSAGYTIVYKVSAVVTPMPLKSYSRLRTGTTCLLILIGLALLAALGLSYQQQTRQARHHLEPTSIQATKLMQRQLQDIGGALDILADAGRRYFSGSAAITELDTRITNLHRIISSVGNFALLDAEGFVIATNIDSIYMQNLGYREYFTRTREISDPATLVVSPPFDALTGRRIFTLSRAIVDDSGAFAGVIVASVDTTVLHAMIELRLEGEEHGSLQFIIAHGDGTPIFSVPDNVVDLDSNLNRPGLPVAQHLASQQKQSALSGRIDTGSPEALIDIRTVQPAELKLSDPLLVLTLTEKQALFAPWRDLAIGLALLFAFVVAGSLLLLRHEKRHLHKANRIRQELATQTRRLSSIIEGTNVGTWEWNVQTGKTIFNERWADMIGYRLEELQPTTIDTWMHYAHPDDLQRSTERLEAHFAGEAPYYECEARMRHRDGYWIWVLDRGKVASWTDDGQPEWMFGTHQEITERKEAEQRASQLAYFDSLTELPNRRLLGERLESALAQARRHKRTLALMFLDLDNFKHVNDTLGHHMGDRLLNKVARRLRGCVRESDTVARTGGDEFIVLLPEISTPRDANQVAEKILERLREPFHLGEHEIHTSPSIGIAIFPHDGLDSATLMDNADQAMYSAKRAGRGCYRLFEAPEPSPLVPPYEKTRC